MEKKEENETRVKFDEEKDEQTKRMTRSMTDVKRKEMKTKVVSMFWMQKENSECYDDITIYTVEVPVREHKKPEIIEAKQKKNRKFGKVWGV